jgi:hypothetical protein
VTRVGDTRNEYIIFVVISREMFTWKAQGDGAETESVVDGTHLVLINLSHMKIKNNASDVSWVGS